MKKRILVAEKRACGARQASTPRQQSMHWELPGTRQGPLATYISLSESDLFPGDSAAPACLDSTNEPEGAPCSLLVLEDERFRAPRHLQIA